MDFLTCVLHVMEELEVGTSDMKNYFIAQTNLLLVFCFLFLK